MNDKDKKEGDFLFGGYNSNYCKSYYKPGNGKNSVIFNFFSGCTVFISCNIIFIFEQFFWDFAMFVVRIYFCKYGYIKCG